MNPQNTMICCVDGEKIMQVDYAGRPVKEVGVVAQQYQEALKVIGGYRKKLEDAGILKKEKTPQEMYEEQMAAMKELMSELKSTKEKMTSEIKSVNDRMDKYENAMGSANNTQSGAGTAAAGV